MSYIEFKEASASASGKTKIWHVVNKHWQARLGSVHWYGSWRRYFFTPLADTVFSPDCLRDIANFCEAATKEHKKVKAS